MTDPVHSLVSLQILNEGAQVGFVIVDEPGNRFYYIRDALGRVVRQVVNDDPSHPDSWSGHYNDEGQFVHD